MLTQLAHYDGLSQQQLAGITCVDRSMVTLLVKDMEVRYGWIRRERHAEDNRLVRVYLTKLGREHAAGLAKRIHVLDRHLTRGLTAPQLEQLRVMLQTLKANALKNLGGGGDSLDQEPED